MWGGGGEVNPLRIDVLRKHVQNGSLKRYFHIFAHDFTIYIYIYICHHPLNIKRSKKVLGQSLSSDLCTNLTKGESTVTLKVSHTPEHEQETLFCRPRQFQPSRELIAAANMPSRACVPSRDRVLARAVGLYSC